MLAAAASSAMAPPALAGPRRLGEAKLDNVVVRLYDTPAASQRGEDGHCFRGRDNPADWACNADASRENKRFSLTTPNRENTFYVYTTKKYVTISRSPFRANQAPYCMPDWYRFGYEYHNVDWAGTNHYYCGFFR
ncbi:hypothetical protein [Lentzea sp. HUAS12]|uniref:hypothetical protein n=1 Tax=Lentzea sp. HUAS12 TaxID=2951806 RepID=UPI0020A0BD39|nr:hypothetical protein [Lentzea sp. HUAS12]USX56286.1 hypothetical protein ND450_19940 [Lentzea sp. HUAS12]